MLQEYWKRIPDLESQQKLEALIAHLGSGQLSSLAQLSAYLEGFSSEISQRFLALSRARDVLAGRPEARAMLALVDQALLRMADEQGLEIELGLRIEPAGRRGLPPPVSAISRRCAIPTVTRYSTTGPVGGLAGHPGALPPRRRWSGSWPSCRKP